MNMHVGTAGIVAGPAGRETKLSATALAYAREERKLSRATLERLGVASGTGR